MIVSADPLKAQERGDIAADGALIQRFINSIPQQREEGDGVLKNVRTRAQTTGRVFAVEYDLSGAHADTVFQQLQDDWRYLTDNLHIISRPAYLKRNGKPVVSISGLAFSDKDHIKDQSSRSRSFAGSKQRHMPLSWEEYPAAGGTLSNDSTADHAWASVYAALDII